MSMLTLSGRAKEPAQGDALGCANLGVMYFQGIAGFTRDETRAFSLLEKTCLAGESLGCINLLAMLKESPATRKQALNTLTRACSDGSAPVCELLGLAYDGGQLGLAKSPSLAAGYYRTACEGGRLNACENLGVLHARGLGVRKDDALAAQLFSRACQANPRQRYSCAELRVRGIGVPKDPAAALKTFETICRESHWDWEPSCERVRQLQRQIR